MPLPPPDAARVLTGTPESLLAACRADMQRAKQGIALLYGMTAPRAADAALQAYDEAMGALGDAAARASAACPEVTRSAASCDGAYVPPSCTFDVR